MNRPQTYCEAFNPSSRPMSLRTKDFTDLLGSSKAAATRASNYAGPPIFLRLRRVGLPVESFPKLATKHPSRFRALDKLMGLLQIRPFRLILVEARSAKTKYDWCLKRCFAVRRISCGTAIPHPRRCLVSSGARKGGCLSRCTKHASGCCNPLQGMACLKSPFEAPSRLFSSRLFVQA